MLHFTFMSVIPIELIFVKFLDLCLGSFLLGDFNAAPPSPPRMKAIHGDGGSKPLAHSGPCSGARCQGALMQPPGPPWMKNKTTKT